MRKILFIAGILLPMLLCLSGCSIGDGIDTIKLSTKYVIMDATSQTYDIDTEGEFFIDYITYSTEKDGVEIKDWTISQNYKEGEYDYTGPWFSIRTSEDRHRITIDVDENKTDIARTVRVYIYFCDYHDSFVVTQSSKN